MALSDAIVGTNKYIDPIMLVDRPYVQVEYVNGIGLYFSTAVTDMSGKLFTSDPLEAVAAMQASKTLRSVQELWTIDFGKYDSFSVDPIAALYWLSGGDNAWKSDVYVDEWDILSQEFSDEFSEELYDKAIRCKTTGGLRRSISRSFTPQRMLEFALSEKLMRI